MARYISDQNKVALVHESGTYGVSSGPAGVGIWPGQVMNHDFDESEGLIETRFLGVTGRNFNVFEQGPRDYSGKLTVRVQDFRFIGWAIGSVTDTSGTNFSHTVTEIDNNLRQSPFTSGTLNPPISFTLEDSKLAFSGGKNFIRTINGCVPTKVSLKLTQSQPAMADIEYVAQVVTLSSGTPLSLTANASRPYLWSDGLFTFAGNNIITAKEIIYELDNTTVSPHYVNGSRVISVPFQTNREHTISLTLDADNDSAKLFYEQYFLGGSTFNATIDLNADNKAGVTGSQHATLNFSGCRLTDMKTPSPNEGVVEQTVTIRPQTVSAIIYDRVGSYNPY